MTVVPTKELKEKLIELSVCNIITEHTLRSVFGKANSAVSCLQNIVSDKQVQAIGKSNLDTADIRLAMSSAVLDAEAGHSKWASTHKFLNEMAIDIFGEDELKDIVASALKDPRVVALDGGR